MSDRPAYLLLHQCIDAAGDLNVVFHEIPPLNKLKNKKLARLGRSNSGCLTVISQFLKDI